MLLCVGWTSVSWRCCHYYRIRNPTSSVQVCRVSSLYMDRVRTFWQNNCLSPSLLRIGVFIIPSAVYFSWGNQGIYRSNFLTHIDVARFQFALQFSLSSALWNRTLRRRFHIAWRRPWFPGWSWEISGWSQRDICPVIMPPCLARMVRVGSCSTP